MTYHSMFDLTGKVALVTGAASGIGFACAEILAEAGADVTLADMQPDSLEQAVAGLRERGLKVNGIEADVAKPGRIGDVVAAIVDRTGTLDIAFANAGMSAGPGPFTEAGTIEAVDPARWARVLDVNLTGVFATIQAAAAPMKRQKSGRIVVTASTAGFRGDAMVGYAYVATKAAVVNLVRQAAIDLSRYGVLVNAIAPGPFRTNIGGGRMHEAATESSFAETLPIGRIGSTDEIKGPALLLASAASSFMTGSVVSVDGGALAW